MFKTGLSAMLDTLKPSAVLVHGFMSDGTIINWRPVSSSDGTPAVDIDVQYSDEHGNLVTQRIHFVKE